MPYLNIRSANDVHTLPDYVTAVAESRSAQEAVLTKTSYEIDIRSGLAFVKLTRKFENKESKPIEAIMTFPVPFDAAVTGITTVIDGRKLVGVSQAKTKARETYEEAIDNGKAAILHEQLLQGLHMISVANVKPGSHIEVEATFVAPLSVVEGTGKLRIPLTIGQIYGDLPLQASDQIVANGPNGVAEVVIRNDQATLMNGQIVSDDKQAVQLGHVLNIEVPDIKFFAMSEKGKDGRSVTLNFKAAPPSVQPLEFDLLLDASGSMMDRDECGVQKWDAMLIALRNVEALGLHDEDKIHLWTFSGSTQYAGVATKKTLSSLVRNLDFAKGTTDLNGAIKTVASMREGANILVMTDGRAGYLDHDGLMQHGLRVTAVLFGADALEANIGSLAQQTGGQMFISFGRQTSQGRCRRHSLNAKCSGPGQVKRHAAGITFAAFGRSRDFGRMEVAEKGSGRC